MDVPLAILLRSPKNDGWEPLIYMYQYASTKHSIESDIQNAKSKARLIPRLHSL